MNYQSTGLTQIDSQFYSGERYGLQLRSPLINVRHYREYERQDALVGQSEEELAVAETELLAEVVEAYLSVLLAEETVLQVRIRAVSLRAAARGGEASTANHCYP